MSDENKKDEPKVQANNNSIAIGNISASGNISDINIKTGYTADQVSVLITQIQSTFQPKPFDGRCPYKGLDVFEEEDAELFFGREKLVDDLVNRVKDSQTVFVTGPSGSGKSSLVRAGLIHALKQGAIKGSDRWLYATMRPGRDPLESLANAFSRLKSPELGNYFRQHVDQVQVLHECAESALTDNKSQRLVLFIDQFEEVFTQISKEEERVAFLNLLTHAATIENGRMIILFSMRSDFVSNCATYPQLNELLSKQFRQIGAMQPEELVSAIAQPALRVGLRIDPDLIAQIINEMKGEPGALPLMQFALKDLFDSQQEKSGVIALTLNDYLQRGGIHKALERHADDSFSKLSKNEQELARSIFSGLIEIGRGTQDTRRTALFDELIPAHTNAVEVESVVRKLADARLITTDEQSGKDTITISHEKLIDAWPWLKKLVNENRDVIALQNEIASDVREWEEHRRDLSYLYTGARLANAREQLEAKKLVLGELAQLFIEAGVKANADELEAAKQSANQLRRRSLYLTVALVVALIAVGVAGFYSVQSRQRAKISRAGELAVLALSEKDSHFNIALLFAVEALHELENSRTQATLFTLTNSHPGLNEYLSGHHAGVISVTFSPDGKLLASGGYDNNVILWDISDPRTPSILATLSGHSNYVFSVAFSPDGKRLASGSADSTIILWDISDPSTPAKLATLSGQSGPIETVAFSPDGKRLASSGYDSTIIMWDVSKPSTPAKLATLSGHTDSVISIAFSPDGKHLASGSADNNIILWDISDPNNPAELATLAGHSNFVFSVAFSPDGKRLASGSLDSTIILWDIGDPSTPTKLATLLGQSDGVYGVAFSPDGKRLASGSANNNIILWDVNDARTPSRLATLLGHSSRVYSVAFSRDGKRLASGSLDNSIILWDVSKPSTPAKLASLAGNSSGVYGVAFSPDGKTLASASVNNTLLWDISDLSNPTKLAALAGNSGFFTNIAFSPDGKRLASGRVEGTITLWDVNDPSAPSKLSTMTGNTIGVISVTFSRDGKRLASGSQDNSIILWDVSDPSTPAKLATLSGHSKFVTSVAMSTDGKHLASGSQDNSIILWDVSDPSTPAKLATLSGQRGPVNSVAFSSDGKLLASGNADNNVTLWDVSKPSAPAKLATLSGYSNSVMSVVFSPDGKRLASGSYDSTIILWDVSDSSAPTELATLSGQSGPVTSVAFSSDGKYLASGSEDSTIILWDLDQLSWVNKACQRAGRNFSRAEWAKYFPNEEYRATCPQWPLEPETTATPTVPP